eukprot:TRINITY_DN1895_c2_g1_i1.p1 TRINITY_DN1895_c2_g1~~TRINITY_DN1895_c2_g1_i1.p1  ORF type:complete len:540 (-),score=182.44 TRINITY_DN1895_c2_g1_i1:152-1705(-)
MSVEENKICFSNNIETLNKWQIFYQWLLPIEQNQNQSQNLINFQQVRIQDFIETGRGLGAIRDMKAFETILSIPVEYILSLLNPKIKEEYEALLDKIEIKDTFIRAIICLLCEKFKDSNSFWKPWFDILPETIDVPIYWHEQDLLLSESFRLIKFIKKRKLSIIATNIEYIIKFSKANPHLLPIEFATIENLSWALTILQSRSFWLDMQDIYSLVPLIDMVNHEMYFGSENSSNGISRYRYSSASKNFTFTILRNYKAGDQVMNCYGQGPTIEYLSLYGWVPNEPNLSDTIQLQLDEDFLQNIDQLADKNDFITKLLSFYRVNVRSKLNITAGRFCWTIICILRILHTNIQEFEIIKSKHQFTDSNLDYEPNDSENQLQEIFPSNDIYKIVNLTEKQVPWVSIENEIKVCSTISRSIIGLMQHYTTTIKEDEELLKNGNLSYSKYLAISFRKQEKFFFMHVAGYFEILRRIFSAQFYGEIKNKEKINDLKRDIEILNSSPFFKENFNHYYKNYVELE